MSDDTISRQAAIDALRYAQHRFTVADEAGGMGTVKWSEDVIYFAAAENVLANLPSAQPEEVIPYRNYKYLSDYWCACGWHLGKKGDVKYCADCGRKVKWDE